VAQEVECRPSKRVGPDLKPHYCQKKKKKENQVN
jgi:hypothetical protein